MAIVTLEYYQQTYVGEAIASNDFPRASAAAERVITQATHGRAANYAALPAYQQDAIKTAICAQIEYYAMDGVSISINGNSAPDFTVGKVSVKGSSTKSAGASMLCAAAVSALEQSGLLNPLVATLGDCPPYPLPWGCC